MGPPNAAAGVLTLDLAALAQNWRSLAQRVAPARCGAVIKANAYGIGIEAAAPALYRAGCRVFFVAHAGEGKRARAALDLARGVTIYVLNGLEENADPHVDYLAPGLSPVIGSPAEAERWMTLAADLATPLPYAIHVDTGMNRLGFANADEALAPKAACASSALAKPSRFMPVSTWMA